MVGRRVTRWARWRTVCLVFLLLLPGTPETLSRLHAERAARDRALAALAPGRNTLPAPTARHQAAPPAPSGAYPPYPLNHTFDGDVVTLPGSPANADFETAAYAVGTPPTNAGFATGTFAGWTTGGAPTIVASGGPDGPYARLDWGDSITSSPFTVDAAAQFGTVRITKLTASADQVNVAVLSGSGYGTSTTVIAGAAPATWTTYRFGLAAWRGQSIELRVTRSGVGAGGVDDVGVQRVEVPSWVPGDDAVYVAGSPSGNAVRTSGSLTSAAFTLPADVQQLSLRYRVSDANGTGLYPELLTGSGFATVVALSGGPLGGTIGAWTTYKAPVHQYAGQQVKLRLRPQLQPVYVDDAGVLEQVVPGWTLDPSYAGAAAGSDADDTYVTTTGSQGTIQLTSSPINAGIVDVPNRTDGRSYTVRYAEGTSGTASFFVYYDEPGPGGQSYAVYADATAGTTPRWGRFTLWDWLAPGGRLRVKATGGGRIYSIGDNAARQQLSEPFSQQAGAGIDTSTGSFGWAETDLTVEGGPLPLVFTRYYRGHSDRYGALGFRWSHGYDTYLAVYAGGDAAVVFGSGREEVFAWGGSSFAPVDVRVKSTLTRYANPPDGVDYRYVTKDNLTYNFTASGDLISVVDPNGNAVTLYRDPQGRVTTVTDPGQRALALAYDGNGRLSTVTGPDGAAVTYSYDGNGDLVAVDKPANARTEYAYSKHRLTQVKRRQGADLASAQMVTVLTNALDQVNRVVQQTDAAGKTTAIAYLAGSDQGITSLTDPLGKVTDFYFDRWARTTHAVAPSGDVTQFVYDGDGNLQKWIDGNGGQYRFAYSTDADPTTVTDALGNPATVGGYTAQHLPTQTVLDPGAAPHLNLTTTYTYDSRGNLTQQVVDPGGTGHLNLTTIWAYDATTGFMLSMTVDPGGLNLLTTYDHDASGNLTRQVVDPGASPHLNLVTTRTYDGAGRVATETVDPGTAPHLNQTTTFSYDLAGRLVGRKNALGESLLFGYDTAGNLTLVRDELGHEATMTYDADNRPTSRTDPAGKTWATAYDAAGHVVAETDPLGRITAYTYDAAGRVATKTVDAGAAPHLNLTTTYGYDAAGRLASVTDPLHRTTAYAYDANGRLTGRTDPNGGVWTYAYDAAGRLTSVTDPLTHATAYAYDAANRLTSETDPTGHVTTYGYDAANRRTSVGRVLDGTTTLTTGYLRRGGPADDGHRPPQPRDHLCLRRGRRPGQRQGRQQPVALPHFG